MYNLYLTWCPHASWVYLLAWVIHVSLTLINIIHAPRQGNEPGLSSSDSLYTKDPVTWPNRDCWLADGWWWRGCLARLPGSMSSLSLMQIRVKVVVFLARSFYWGKLASRPILCNILNLEIWIFILPPCTIMVYCNLPQLEIVFALVTEVLILLDTERLT